MAPQWTRRTGRRTAPNWWRRGRRAPCPCRLARTRRHRQPRDARHGVVDLDHRGCEPTMRLRARPVDRRAPAGAARGRPRSGRGGAPVERLGDVVGDAEAGGDRRGLDRPRAVIRTIFGGSILAQRERSESRPLPACRCRRGRGRPRACELHHRLGDAGGPADGVPRLLEARAAVSRMAVSSSTTRIVASVRSFVRLLGQSGRTTRTRFPFPRRPHRDVPRAKLHSRTSERPRPSPSAPPVPLPRTNLLKTFSRSASGSPPSSVTVRSASSPRSVTARRTGEAGARTSARSRRGCPRRGRGTPRPEDEDASSAWPTRALRARRSPRRRAASAPRSTGGRSRRSPRAHPLHAFRDSIILRAARLLATIATTRARSSGESSKPERSCVRRGRP